MAHMDDDRQTERPSERPLERKGIDVIQPERPPAVDRLPKPPPRPRKPESG